MSDSDFCVVRLDESAEHHVAMNKFRFTTSDAPFTLFPSRDVIMIVRLRGILRGNVVHLWGQYLRML